MPTFALITLMVSMAVAVLLAAIAVHGRIAGQAVRRARTEDVPEVLEISSRALAGMVGCLRFRLRQVLPGTDSTSAGTTTVAAADRGAASTSEAGTEGVAS
ncbi:hypothetical protein ACFY3J_30780 [Streptomyces sp. NPDC001231]|uniref:hypothetical protein n=1 Tax=Streptomyces sp. NPDC001231 TaxID=3364549 RepID=UPI0036899BA7